MVNWNNALSYSTLKVVKVRDWRLGLLHYLFQVGIAAYVIGYAVLYERGFMFKEQIVGGSVTLNSQAPPRTNAAAFYSNGGVGGAYSYYSNGLLKNANNSFCCDSAVESCKNGTQLQNASDSQLPCLYWGEGMAEYPAPTNAELVLTSRVSISTETAAEGCTSAASFIYNFEDFTIRIRHGVRGQQVNKEGISTGDGAIPGKLVDGAGNKIRFWPDPQPFVGQPQNQSRSGDIVSVTQLLQANEDTSATAGNGAISPRYDGINVIVNIRYEMVGILGNTLEYTYEPRRLSNLEYKIEEAVYSNAGVSRTIYNRHGVRFIFIQTGVVGSFDLTDLLITLVTGLGLLAVATTFVDFTMSYILQGRDVYNAYKVLETTDLKYLRDKSEDELQNAVKTYKSQLPQIIQEQQALLAERARSPISGSSSN
eukprot:gene2444-16107_t